MGYGSKLTACQPANRTHPEPSVARATRWHDLTPLLRVSRLIGPSRVRMLQAATRRFKPPCFMLHMIHLHVTHGLPRVLKPRAKPRSCCSSSLLARLANVPGGSWYQPGPFQVLTNLQVRLHASHGDAVFRGLQTDHGSRVLWLLLLSTAFGRSIRKALPMRSLFRVLSLCNDP